MASELESYLQDTVDWGRKWLFVFNAGKTKLVSFDWFNNTVAIDVKLDGSVLEEKSSFKISTAKTASKKIKLKFLSLRLLFMSINLPYGHAWNWQG